MKNTVTKIFTLLLALVCSLSLLVGCDATVDEDAFRKALTDALSNVTMDVEYTSESMSYSRTVRSVDGKTYLKGDDGKWVETTSENTLVLIIGAIAKHYDAFTFEDGAYQAGRLHLVDAEGHYADVDNVRITFDLTGNAKSITFNEVDSDGVVCTHSLKLSFHGTTTAPDDITSGDKTSSGTITNDGVSDGFGSSDDSFKPIGGTVDGGSTSPDGTLIPGDSSLPGNTFVPGDSSTGEVSLGIEVDEKKWIAAFNLGDNYSATLKFFAPNVASTYLYRVVDGVVYYCEEGKELWSLGSLESITSSVDPFRERFGEFEYGGYMYYCESMEIDGNSVIDISAIFDSNSRLAEINHTLLRNGECGSIQILISDYGITEAPTLSSGESIGESEGTSENTDDGIVDKQTPDK
ncbi:MAG: hypothetical protein IJW66_02830 [Clostridia bacterium]|nr:hypothetical protein [Clostridia bacterium]